MSLRKPIRPDRRPCSSRSGFTLIEVCISLALCTVTVLGFAAAVQAGSDLQRRTETYSSASRTVSRIHEHLHGEDIDISYASYRATPIFEEGDMTVEVRFPEQLLVDALGAAPPVGWRYRDLDADGQVDLDPAADSQASLLPVTVLVTWAGGRMHANFLATER